MQSERRESVFELIKTMNKAEKRNFKLYATRLAGNEGAKFLQLFDALDEMESYDEGKILRRCSVKKEQLPNMKAHLYRQILVSLRLLNAGHSVRLQLREQVDFARILFDKGLYRQAGKLLDKAAVQAEESEQFTILLDIVDLQKQVKVMNVPTEMTPVADNINRQSVRIFDRLENIGELYNLSVRLHSLHLQLGYARSQKDLDLLDLYFKPKLDLWRDRVLSFTERFYFYQAMAWYHYIRHNFAYSYRYGRAWIALFEQKPRMKQVLYDSYMHGYAWLLEGMYLMRKYSLFVETLRTFESESTELAGINENAEMISRQILFVGQLNKCLLEGAFKEGLWLVRNIDGYLRKFSKKLIVSDRMMLNYKIACLYFGDGNYARCMEYLSFIIAVKDPQIRRDLQCYGRMLNLIASYDAGIDYNLDYQIRSVYTFIVKMKDMTDMKRAFFLFFKKLSGTGALSMKQELKALYKRLKPYETHPYERRTFYYLDLMSWLESKISGRNFGDIVRGKFDRLLAEEHRAKGGDRQRP